MSQATIDLVRRELETPAEAPQPAPHAGLLEVGRPAAAARPGHHRGDAGAAAASSSSRSARRWSPSDDPYAGSVLTRLKPIGTPGHWLGTDETGRDLWTRLCYGGRLSLLAGDPAGDHFADRSAASSASSPAMPAGIVGTLIMRTMDVFYAFPSILLAIAICGLLGNGLSNSILALAVVFIPPMVRDFGNRHDTGAASRFRRGGARVRHHHAADHPPSCAGERAGADPGLRDQPDQRIDHPVGRAVLPRPRRHAAAGGMGADAELAAPGDLRAALRRRAAGR